MPLLIDDILKINIDGENFNLYGQSFRKVMCYGVCMRDRVKYTKVENDEEEFCENKKQYYVVDDGTARIMVSYNHTGPKQRGNYEVKTAF